MDSKLLEDFITLCEEKNFTSASSKRFITQSAFSRRIQKLEEWAGSKLVIRHKSTISLTPAGKDLLIYAKKIIKNIDNAKNTMGNYTNGTANKVIISAQNTIIRNFIPSWIDEIEKIVGKGYWSLKSEKMQLSVDSFLNNKVDFLFFYKNKRAVNQLNKTKHNYTKVGQEILLPVAKVGGEYENISLEKSKKTNVPYLAYSADSFFGIEMKKVFENNKIDCLLHAVFDHHYSNVLRNMVLEDRGIAWLPLSGIQHDLDSQQLKIIGSTSWYMSFDIILCYHKKYTNLFHKSIVRKLTSSSN